MPITPHALNEALPAWDDSARATLRGGHLPVDVVQSLSKGDVENLMLEILPVARLFAIAPLSNFKVGAVARGTTGALYLGANIEVPGNALSQTVHAEQSAVANAFAHHEKGITAIAVTAAPCGHCRQFMNEITDAGAIRVVVMGQSPQTLVELLPASFGPRDLGINHGLMSTHATNLRLVSGTRDALALAGLQAATRAYAPHTKSLSGCGVGTKTGRVFTGSYLENAAFNPSLPPLQGALVNLAFAGEEFSNITRVALVEMRGAPISHRDATESALRAIASKARLDLFWCEKA